MIISRAAASPVNAEFELLGAVVPSANFTVKIMYLVFAVLSVRFIRTYTERVKCCVSIPPELESLYRANALDFSETISATMDVGPHYVHVKKVNEVFAPDVALKLDRPFDGSEFVPNLDVLVMDTDAFVVCVTNSMRFLKGQISFHIGGVVVWAMARVEGMRMNI